MKIATIKIQRAEGPSHLCDVEKTAQTFADARRILRLSSKTAPTGGGYDKHDVVFTWEDGTKLAWRADVTGEGEDTDPSAYLTGFAARIAGGTTDAKTRRIRAAMRENAPEMFAHLEQVAERILSGDLATEDKP